MAVLTFTFDPVGDIPIVSARIRGPRKTRRVRLVFDTGSAISQIDTGSIEDIGYSASTAEQIVSIQSAVGESIPGYLLRIDSLSVFGLDFRNQPVGAFDFDNFDQHRIDGLLGFDLIKQLHLELNGPAGTFSIFGESV